MKNGIGKHKEGRPTKFAPEMLTQVEKLCMLGAKDTELADFFEVAESTINEWKITHPEFSESLMKGKQLADAHVAHSLYKRATGYEHEDVDIKMYEGQIIETSLIKHYPPNPTSMIFWLKNRRPKDWRDKQDGEQQGVTINQMIIITKDDVTKKELENLR